MYDMGTHKNHLIALYFYFDGSFEHQNLLIDKKIIPIYAQKVCLPGPTRFIRENSVCHHPNLTNIPTI